jgi:hypothetical protein
VRVSNGDRDTFYSWLEGGPEHMPPPNLSTRPLSPAPFRSRFASAEEFHDEQARWFRDHGDGSDGAYLRAHGVSRTQPLIGCATSCSVRVVTVRTRPVLDVLYSFTVCTVHMHDGPQNSFTVVSHG